MKMRYQILKYLTFLYVGGAITLFVGISGFVVLALLGAVWGY